MKMGHSYLRSSAWVLIVIPLFQGLQAHWESRESLVAHLKQETDALHANINDAFANFLKYLQGFSHNPANVGEIPDANDVNWGQMDFTCCHACIEVC